jgi:glycosyltransferase involved in cell wall biosynthesis
MIEWHFLTGEYPPQLGGVSDYCRLLACALAQTGDKVHIWAPPSSGADPVDPGVHVHRLPDTFGPRSLRVLGKALSRPNPVRRLLVQYVPHAFGWKAMNLPFCLWLYGRRHRDRIWVMFHEVAYDLSLGQSLRHNVLGCVTHMMAAFVSRAAERCFASTSSWFPMVWRVHSRRRVEWLSIPSNLPTEAPPEAVAQVRTRYGANAAQPLVGHFGTFGELIAPLVEKVIPEIVATDPKCIGLLMGRGSDQWLPRLRQSRPDLADRLFATGALSASELATHLAACDLLVQPYPDGVTTRRTSVMAPLALGVPIVTTSGFLTEPLWHQENLVALAPVESPAEIVAQAEKLLKDASARHKLGKSGQDGYQRLFAIERTVQTLRRLPTYC